MLLSYLQLSCRSYIQILIIVPGIYYTANEIMVGSNVSCVRSVHFFMLSIQHEMAQSKGENFDLLNILMKQFVIFKS